MRISEKRAKQFFYELRDFEWEDDNDNRCSVYVCAYDRLYKKVFNLKRMDDNVCNCYIFANLKTPHRVELIVNKEDDKEYFIEKRYDLTGTGAIWLLKEIKELAREE